MGSPCYRCSGPSAPWRVQVHSPHHAEPVTLWFCLSCAEALVNFATPGGLPPRLCRHGKKQQDCDECFELGLCCLNRLPRDWCDNCLAMMCRPKA
jgi:hypothetical protein